MVIINRFADIGKRRRLRKEQTPEETIVWDMVRNNRLGCKWRRQISIGAYIADFYCHDKKIVLEIDGIQHNEEKAKEYDAIRTEFFKSRGIKTLRIANKEIRENSDIVYQKIINYLALC